MKRIVSLFAVSILLTCVAGAIDAPTAERTINDSEAALGVAMIHKDLATLNRLVGNDWTIQSDSEAVMAYASPMSDRILSF